MGEKEEKFLKASDPLSLCQVLVPLRFNFSTFGALFVTQRHGRNSLQLEL